MRFHKLLGVSIMAAIPGRKKEMEIKKKSGNKAQEPGKSEDSGVDELTFDQMKEESKELKKLREDHSREQLKKIKQMKLTENPKKNNKKGDTRINLKDITTETEERKGGMPDHIAALPETHAIRVRWEKGFRQRADGTWYHIDDGLSGGKGLSENQKHALLLIPLILIGLVMVLGGNWYADELHETKKQIFKTVKHKELHKNDPATKMKLIIARDSKWLPELSGILTEFKQAKDTYTSFGDNSEDGSYVEYIRKNNKKFNSVEAMEWRTRVIRKPSQ